MFTDNNNTTGTNPPQTVFCPPVPNVYFKTLDTLVPYFVNGSLNAALVIPTTFANLVVLLAMRHITSIRLPSKLLLCSLVLTDLGAGLVVLPLRVAWFFTRGSDPPLCPLHSSLLFNLSVFSFATLYTLTAMSLDRYTALFFHLSYQQIVTTRRVCAALTSVWLFSLLFASSAFWNFQLWSGLMIVSTILALAVISVAYIKIYRRLRGQQVQPRDQAQQQAGNSPNVERYRRTASAIMWVYVLFVICYLPYLCVTVIIQATGYTLLIVCISGFTYTVVLLNSCLNPFVYCLRLPEVRIEVMKQLRKFCCRNSQ